MSNEKNPMVYKHNHLIEAQYELSLNEQRAILFSISKLNFNEDLIVKFNIAEFLDTIGSAPTRYTEVKKLLSNLRQKELLIKKIDQKGLESELILGWFASVEMVKNTGDIEIEFSNKLKPYLLNLTESYTKYEIKQILRLKSKYSIRIYELAKQYATIGKRTFSLDEFKRIIKCPKYSPTLLRTDIIEPAVKDINENTDINIIVSHKKQGRNICGLEIDIISKNRKKEYVLCSKTELEELKEKLKIRQQDKELNNSKILELFEIAWEKTLNWEEDEDINPHDYFKINYAYSLRLKPRNLYAYLKECLEKDHAKAIAQMKSHCVIDNIEEWQLKN